MIGCLCRILFVLISALSSARIAVAQFTIEPVKENAELFELAKKCNENSVTDINLDAFLWNDSRSNNLHLLIASNDCVSRVATAQGAKALRTVFMFGKPELMYGVIDSLELKQEMLTSIYYGDRLAFRRSAEMLPMLLEMKNDGSISGDEFDLIWAFSASARMLVGNFDYDVEEIPPNILEYLPDGVLTHDYLVSACSQSVKCSKAADEEIGSEFCELGRPEAEKGLMLYDPERFQLAIQACGLSVIELVQYFRIYGIFDGLCSGSQQANAAINTTIAEATSCEDTFRNKDRPWVSEVRTAMDALSIGYFSERIGFESAADKFGDAISRYGLADTIADLMDIRDTQRNAASDIPVFGYVENMDALEVFETLERDFLSQISAATRDDQIADAIVLLVAPGIIQDGTLTLPEDLVISQQAREILGSVVYNDEECSVQRLVFPDGGVLVVLVDGAKKSSRYRTTGCILVTVLKAIGDEVDGSLVSTNAQLYERLIQTTRGGNE